MLGITKTEKGFEWTSNKARFIWIGSVTILIIIALIPAPQRTYEPLSDLEAQAIVFDIRDRLDDDVTFDEYIASPASQRAATARWERWLHTGDMVVPENTEAVSLDPETRRLMDCLDTSENHADKRYHTPLITDRAFACVSSGQGAIRDMKDTPQ